MIDIDTAKKILENDFIWPEELKSISGKFSFKINNVPPINISMEDLIKLKNDFILILGISESLDNQKININILRNIFGCNPEKKEPCFYNQDRYIKEDFANNVSLKDKRYIIKKHTNKTSRWISPEYIELSKNEHMPSALLTTYTFFCYYSLYKEILWKNEYIWCSDKDHNGDRIYTWRYQDPEWINKNGFSIHRHLSISNIYGLAPEIII